MPLNAGQSAFPLVSTPDHYIEANIRETDLTYVREGDPARITVDAYPDSPIAGKVTTLAPASGSLFALLPQNATGNWLKVVQRIPVRLSIDTVPNGVALRAGMSVKISISTRGNVRSMREACDANQRRVERGLEELQSWSWPIAATTVAQIHSVVMISLLASCRKSSSSIRLKLTRGIDGAAIRDPRAATDRPLRDQLNRSSIHISHPFGRIQ
jgi:hypothetical protein